MTYIRDLFADLEIALLSALNTWRRQRYLRGGWRNPDELPF